MHAMYVNVNVVLLLSELRSQLDTIVLNSIHCMCV